MSTHSQLTNVAGVQVRAAVRPEDLDVLRTFSDEKKGGRDALRAVRAFLTRASAPADGIPDCCCNPKCAEVQTDATKFGKCRRCVVICYCWCGSIPLLAPIWPLVPGALHNFCLGVAGCTLCLL